ncbi:MAG: SurA N-terminal domain-containing protein [Desulfomonilia bacterium]|jgi:peptidyl-prolyl cis-trans isomerase D
MLTYMRKRSKSWITKFIFGAIIIVFVFWGGSAYWSKEANKVAKIDRYIITQQQFAKAYSDALRLYQARLGDAFTPEVLAQLDLKKTVLDQMINDYIVNDEARKLGVSVSDEELQEAIRTFPAFQQNGQFSLDSYKRLLQYQRMTPAEFEEQQRKAFFQQRVYSMITENIIVSPQEVEAYYQYQNDSFNLHYLSVDAQSFSKDAVVGDEEAAAYYETNKERYKIAPRIVLTAVLFPVERYFDEAAVSVDEARDYYDSHRQEFAEEAKIHGRHILIRVPQDADQTTIDKKRAAAQKIYDQVKAGGNFAELAKKYSEDPGTSAAGGDIGTVPQSSLPASMAEAFSGMKHGEVRGPVQTALGFHVLKLEKKSEAKQRSFEEVSASIVERMRHQRAKIIARDEAGNAHMELFEQGINDLAGYAESKGLETREIGPFAEGENIGIAGSEEFVRQAFTLPQGEIGAVVETDEGCIIYMVKEKIAARIPEFQEIRSRVVEDVLAQKSLEKAKEHAGDLAKKTLAELNAMSPESTGEFRRTSYLVPKLGMIEGLQDDLGSLQDPKVYTHRNTVYVVWLKEKKEALASGAGENELKRIREELLLRKKEMAIKAFIEEARKRHDVVIDYAKIT